MSSLRSTPCGAPHDAMTARITVRLTPRGGRDAIDGWDGELLRARVSAAPTDGKANEALIRLLAKALGVPPTSLGIVAGRHSRTKTLEAATLTDADLRQRLRV